jgi:hypothetical protein
MNHLSHRGGRLTRLAAPVLTVAALVIGTTPGVASASAPAAGTEKAGWPRVATVSPKAGYELPVLAAAPNRRWLSVAQRNRNGQPRDRAMLVRGRANGATDRAVYPVGDVLFTRIDRHGNALVVGFSERGLVAVSWASHRARPRTHAFGISGYGSDFEALSNARGDVALHWSYGMDKQYVLRKRAGHDWDRILRIGKLRYDGTQLQDLDLDARGRLVGAFLDDNIVSVRSLGVRSRVFTRAHEVLTVPGYAGVQPGYTKQVTITVGPSGDRVVTLSLQRLGEDVPRYGHAVILPSDGPRWDGEWSHGTFNNAVVGASGRVTVPLWEEPGEAEVVQWTPRRRTFVPLDGQWLRASTPRGDLLLSDAEPDGNWELPAHLSLRPDGRRALVPVSARGAGTAPVALAGQDVFGVFVRGHVHQHYVLTKKTFRS